MRKIVILALLVVMIWGAYTVILPGVSYGNLQLENYKSLQQKSLALTTSLQSLDTQNSAQYNAKKIALMSAVKSYEDAKEQYETILPEMQAATEEEDSSSQIAPVDLYDIDFLWTIIGNYATEEGVSLQFDVTKSTSAPTTFMSTSEEYIFCDLNFTVSGDYITITDFIYDIEDDDRLKFEISNFSLEKGGENLETKFSVKSVPINNNNLSTLTTSNTESTDSTDPTNTISGTNTSVTDPSTMTNTVPTAGTTDPMSSATNTTSGATSTVTNTITQ